MESQVQDVEQTKRDVKISQDGIAIFDGFFPDHIADTYIKYFDVREKAGFVKNRQETQGFNKSQMSDKQWFLANGEFLVDLDVTGISQEFLKIFWEQCYKIYENEFDVLKTFQKHSIFNLKVQKTDPGEGYHIWHCEDSNRQSRNRILTFILYLNDVEEGGETEFLYMRRRVKPQKSRFVLWPAGLTHTHRGNPPLSGTKYIMTGWVEF